MARGRTIYATIHASKKFNALYEQEGGELAQLVWLLSYPHADDWGHLPYEAEWLHLTCLGKTKRTQKEIEQAMNMLAGGLWSTPYTVDNKQYVYINKFEVLQRDGIRHRRRGEHPDELGEIPRRLPNEDIVSSLQKSAEVRAQSPNHGILRNITSCYRRS